ncbi:hypothetical protein JCM3775_004273 [Rhodotorula graminis]
MTKSPKHLLPTTIPLSSIHRALSSSSTRAGRNYSARAVARPHQPAAQGQGQAHGGPRAAFVVVRQRRAPSTPPLSGSSPRPTAQPASPSSTTTGTTTTTASSSGPDAPHGLRHASTVAPSHRPEAGPSRPSPSSSSSSSSSAGVGSAPRSSSGRGVARFLDARQFHSGTRAAHQQAVAPSSSSGHGGFPPGSGGAPSEASGFQPKHHSSLATPGGSSSSSSHGSTSSVALDPSSSSSSTAPASSSSAQSAQQQTSTSTSQQEQQQQQQQPPPATLFTHAPPQQLPPHALPSFFGSALSIARRSNLVFRNGAYGIPKPDRYRIPSSKKGKEKAGAGAAAEQEAEEHYLSVGVGEDSYFLRSDSLGVADGVGGWSGHAGANSARWARKFMHHCSYELARYENVDDDMFLRYYEVDPVDVMQRAYEKTLGECKEEGTIGSSTALLAVLRNDELRLANLGDCSCCVIRGDEYIFRSEEQQHRFNYPFQAGTNAKDVPARDAQKFTVKVQRDDIVILASDGLVDNVFSDDLLEEVLRFVGSSHATSSSSSSAPLPPPPPSSSSSLSSSSTPAPRYTLRRFSPQAVSEALCFRAKSVYEDQRAVASPFQQRAMDEGIHFAGGKPDDVSCLVGVVGELEAAPNRRDVQ